MLETLANWKGHLEKATRIFLAAPGANAATLFEEGSPLSPTDARLANVPFTTIRPTFSETKRVIAGLLSLLEPEAAPQPESQKAPDVRPPIVLKVFGILDQQSYGLRKFMAKNYRRHKIS